MPSFDIVSRTDLQEVDNAIQGALREIAIVGVTDDEKPVDLTPAIAGAIPNSRPSIVASSQSTSTTKLGSTVEVAMRVVPTRSIVNAAPAPLLESSAVVSLLESSADALEWLARDVARRCGLRVDLTVDGELEPLPDAHRTCIYRVVQEALTNVLKHAGAELTDVVEITTYQLDMSKFPDVVGNRLDVFGPHRPAWTAVGVQSMPMPSMQFQISARAYGPDRRKPLAGQAREATPKKEKPPQRFMNRPGY